MNTTDFKRSAISLILYVISILIVICLIFRHLTNAPTPLLSIFQVLEDILKFSRPREYPVDPTHLGTLFVMDQTKDGKFWVEEIVDFAALYAEKQQSLAAAVDFLVRPIPMIFSLFERINFLPASCSAWSWAL
jgi:hypothetical protein